MRKLLMPCNKIASQVQTSCGYGVPLLAMTPSIEGGEVIKKMNDRDTLSKWAENKLNKGELESYQAEWNSNSLDGLPSMRAARKTNGKILWVGDAAVWLRKMRWDAYLLGIAVGATFGVIGTRVIVGRS